MNRHSRLIAACLLSCWPAFFALAGAAADDDLSRLSKRRLSSASELDYPPFALVRDDGTADGFSVDLLKAVCRAVGLDIAFKVSPWHEIKNELAEGRLDVLPLVARSIERDREFDFTAPYLRMRGTIFVRKGERSIRDETDLKGKEVLVMQADMAHEYAVRKRLTDKLILTDSVEAAMQRLSAGEHDAVIVQHLVGLQLIKQLGISNVVSIRSFDESSLKPGVNPLSGFEQKICMAVKEGDKDLLARLNEGLSLVIAQGVYDELYDKWFGPIIPPPTVSPARIAKYLLYILVPLLALIGISYAWLLKREVARKTHMIKENEERLKRAQEIAHLGSWELDLQTNALNWSDEMFRIIGLEPQSFSATYEAFLNSVHPDDRRKVDDAYAASLRGNRNAYDVEHRVVRPDGTIRHVHEKGEHFRDSTGRIGRLVGMVHDITERKNAEAAMRRLSQFPEENPNPVLRITIEGALLYMNAAARDMLTVLNWQDGKPLPSELNVAVERVGEQGRAVDTEIAIPDGRTFSFFAIQPLNEDYINLYGMDLTERKRAETALRDSEDHLKASLAEKEVLLKEIHHRVKNNMQVISSLVDLQADEVGDAAMRDIFQDVVNRVRSMAMVHEKLYQSSDLARVEFADYTETLLGYLWRAQKGAASGIQLDLDLAPVFLPVHLAVPCGLVLNELFSNALKHAFHGRDSGRVTVSLQEDGDGKVHLEVSDDGIGLPPGFDWQKATSLGLRLVQMLARQLKATVKATNDTGAAFSIRFERPKP